MAAGNSRGPDRFRKHDGHIGRVLLGGGTAYKPVIQHAQMRSRLDTGRAQCDDQPELHWYAFTCVANSIEENDGDTFGHIKYSHISQHGIRLTHPRFKPCNELTTGLLGSENEAVLTANMLREQVHPLVAEQMYRRALAGKETALGQDHTSTLKIARDPQRLHRAQDRVREAGALNQRYSL